MKTSTVRGGEETRQEALAAGMGPSVEEAKGGGAEWETQCE